MCFVFDVAFVGVIALLRLLGLGFRLRGQHLRREVMLLWLSKPGRATCRLETAWFLEFRSLKVYSSINGGSTVVFFSEKWLG